jgi:hypothetical protein
MERQYRETAQQPGRGELGRPWGRAVGATGTNLMWVRDPPPPLNYLRGPHANQCLNKFLSVQSRCSHPSPAPITSTLLRSTWWRRRSGSRAVAEHVRLGRHCLRGTSFGQTDGSWRDLVASLISGQTGSRSLHSIALNRNHGQTPYAIDRGGRHKERPSPPRFCDCFASCLRDDDFDREMFD